MIVEIHGPLKTHHGTVKVSVWSVNCLPPAVAMVFYILPVAPVV